MLTVEQALLLIDEQVQLWRGEAHDLKKDGSEGVPQSLEMCAAELASIADSIRKGLINTPESLGLPSSYFGGESLEPKS